MSSRSSRVDRVHLYVTALGNEFMTDIARMFQKGFQSLGLEANLLFDEVPLPTPPKSLLQLVVAPHEFAPLFLHCRLSPVETNAVFAGCWVLTVEQPGTSWFEVGFQAAKAARGVFDINRLGVNEFRRRGLRAEYTPLGYSPLLEETTNAVGSEKTIDLLFLGWQSPRRVHFFARHARALQPYNCRFIFADASQPVRAGSPNYYSGARRNELIRNSKILLNIHQAERGYFEWHRALCAFANRCLLISEPSASAEPLVNGEHLVFARSSEMLAICEQYLQDDVARGRIVERAYEFASRSLPISRSCQTILDFVGPHSGGSALSPSASSNGVGEAVAMARGQAETSGHEIVPEDPRLVQPIATDRVIAFERRRFSMLQHLATVPLDPAVDSQRYRSRVNPAYPRPIDPIISVVVINYNYARFLKACLDSVAVAAREGLPGPVEIVVVDDCSTDESAQVVESYLQSSPLPIRLVLKDGNTGPAHARNIGVHLARAPYVFPLDADNFIYPKALSCLYQAVTSVGAAGAYAIVGVFDDRTGEGTNLLSQFGWDIDRLLYMPYIDTMALLDRSRVIQIGGYPSELLRYGWGWEDYAFWLRFAQAGFDCVFHPEILTAFRAHSGTTMTALTQWCNTPNFGAAFRYLFSDLCKRRNQSNAPFGFPIDEIPPLPICLDPSRFAPLSAVAPQEAPNP
jgi:hypothetical protein